MENSILIFAAIYLDLASLIFCSLASYYESKEISLSIDHHKNQNYFSVAEFFDAQSQDPKSKFGRQKLPPRIDYGTNQNYQDINYWAKTWLTENCKDER